MRHHRKKFAFLFSAMRHFAAELLGLGWTVDYVTLDDPDNRGSFTEQLVAAIARHRPERVVVTEAGEWRVRQMQESGGGALFAAGGHPAGRALPVPHRLVRAAGRKTPPRRMSTGGSAQRGLANGVHYPVSDESSLVTGSDLVIDGGMTAQ